MGYRKVIGVYILTHLPSGSYYIGSSCNFKARVTEHMGKLRNGVHHVEKLQLLYNHDPDVEISLFILKNTIDEARSLEKQMLEESKDDPLLLNRTLSVDSRFQTGENNHMFGRIVGDEEKARLSAQNRGYCHTDEAKAKIAKSRLGKPLSEEHKKKLSSRARQVSVKGVVYPTSKDAAKALGVSNVTVTAYAGSKKPQHSEWFWLTYD